ncbi:hypothetical protein [Desulfosarcina cetonica]|uniref:hypothetical protein n=1 Tax=Desulfosarcina cetonica TaxID=90730 RepID=UPI001FEDF9AB|nr:hypothetical protein [Desulfosarcina cetonica]
MASLTGKEKCNFAALRVPDAKIDPLLRGLGGPRRTHDIDGGFELLLDGSAFKPQVQYHN